MDEAGRERLREQIERMVFPDERVRGLDGVTVLALLDALDAARAEVAALREVQLERRRQDEMWGVSDHHPMRWLEFVAEEVRESANAAEDQDWPAYRSELVHVAATAIAALEAFDRAALTVGGTEEES